MSGGPDARVRAQICRSAQWRGVTRLGVAVSGGSDSMALLHLLADCAADHGVTLEAATVDHGLRPAAAEEAAFVKATCEALDIQHETLRWTGWDGRGNLQAEARAARYGLLAAWARRRGLDRVALGHTLDDQAETFVMRLARAAGVDGLAAMDAVFDRDGARFWRPALGLARRELRACLERHGHAWREDPSNADESFDRVKARRALGVLAEIGIAPDRLAKVAANLAEASDALKRVTRDTALRIARVEAGDVVLERAGLLGAPDEIRRRLLAAALAWVAVADWPPRRAPLAALERALHALRRDRETTTPARHTLHGCLITWDHACVRIAREYAAVKDLRAPPGALWDGRWRVTGPVGATRDGLEIRALGEAVSACADWRNTGLPRASLMASPALWAGDTLISAPIAGFSGGCSAEIAHPRGDFAASALSH